MQLVIEGSDFFELKTQVVKLAREMTAEMSFHVSLKGPTNEQKTRKPEEPKVQTKTQSPEPEISEAARRYRETQTGEIDDGKAASKLDKTLSKKESSKVSKVKTKSKKSEEPEEISTPEEPKTESTTIVPEVLEVAGVEKNKVDISELRVLLQQVFTTKGLAVAQSVLGEFGFSALKQVPEELYSKVYEKCLGVLD
ncbi:MAG TPA: hypothetical protein PKW79_00185 [Rhabdochlamydiaceae bacterium]|nr:hypothetical protein [Rhabdochlamydiaceae bacterium]